MPARRPSLVRRRNGLLEACEPCRRRKLACDHTVPVCRRCICRRAAASCVYPGSSAVLAADTSREGGQAVPSFNKWPRTPTPELGRGTRATSSPNTFIPTALSGGPSGFLGQTSFSTIFIENESRLKYPERTFAPVWCWDKVDEDMVLLGAKILGQLPDKATCTVLFERYKRARTMWWNLGLEHCLVSIWATFERALSSKHRRISSLEEVSRLISTNTTVPLDVGEDFTDWLKAITSRNVRWELMGILFTSWALGALASPDEAEVFQKQQGKMRDRMQFVTEMKELATSCSGLCKRTRLVNPLSVLLSYNSSILETLINGDSGLTTWTMHLEMIAATTFAGLHRDVGSNTHKITFISEFRRRLFASVYELDKQLATFTGRPPGLSWRYKSCPLPVDVSDETLISGGRDLELAIEALDSHGWNINGQFYPATRLRALCLLSQIRDEILEISLSSMTAETLPRINELKARSHHMHTHFPLSAIYRHDEDEAHTIPRNEDSSLQKMTLVRLALDHLQNHFLLERLAVKCGQVDHQALIDISDEVLHLTNMIWIERDNFQARRYNLEWIAIFYGASAAGVLCVELLSPGHLVIPRRSKTIQSLTIFVAFLAWVRPSAPNADLCLAVKKIVSRVLDQVLEGSAGAGELDETNVLSSWYLDAPLWDDFGNMDHLGTYDYFSSPLFGPEWGALRPEGA